MVIGWQIINNQRYYFSPAQGSEGAMMTGWQLIDNQWYYFNPAQETEGVMMSNTWIDNYYVNSDGVWIE